MPSFQLLRCLVALGGDDDTTVYRDRSRPIVFPEMPILQYLHGEDAITDVAVVGTWDTTNEEVVQRLNTIYAPEAVQAVFPGVRPRLPTGDNSLPACTMPVYKPRPVRPDSPDPTLRPLDQFTRMHTREVEAPPLPHEDEPTADEIAAHQQDDDDPVPLPEAAEDLGLEAPRFEDLPHIVRDTHGRGSSRRASASRVPGTRPDVNAGGGHGPNFEGYTGQSRSVEVR